MSTWTRTPYQHEFRSWWPRYPKRCLICGHRRRNHRHRQMRQTQKLINGT